MIDNNYQLEIHGIETLLFQISIYSVVLSLVFTISDLPAIAVFFLVLTIPQSVYHFMLGDSIP